MSNQKDHGFRSTESWLLALCFLSCASFADEGTGSELQELRKICVGANLIVATETDDATVRDFVFSEALRHAEAARQMGVTDEAINLRVDAMGKAYAIGRFTWEQISETATKCVYAAEVFEPDSPPQDSSGPGNALPPVKGMPYHLHRTRGFGGPYEHIYTHESSASCEDRRAELIEMHNDYNLYCVAADSARINGCESP